jgi:hypothetical protein
MVVSPVFREDTQISAAGQKDSGSSPFFGKKGPKKPIPWNPGGDMSPPELQGTKSFFASFCSQKEDLTDARP